MKRFLLSSALTLLAGLAQAEVINIGNDELKSLLGQGVKLVDLRTAGEWKQTGVVQGSQMITLFDERGRADPEAWKKELAGVSAPDQPVILICRTGNRTGVAAKMLNETMPNRKIYNVKEGITGWMRAGQPVVSVEQNLASKGIRCSPAC